jgi:hypothetical protein
MKISSQPALTPNFREAIIIHICAIAAAGLFTLLETATYQRPEVVALKGMLFAAAVALFLWSLYLAARSCHEGEPLKPVVVFVVIILLELMVFSCSLLYEKPSYSPGAFFEYADYYGCAFYAVFFITLTFLAAPLAWHCARLESPVHESPDAYGLINRAIEIHALFLLLLTAVLLPPALFLYCVSSAELKQPKTWRHEYLEYCPDFVRDTTADMLSLLNTNSNKSLHLRILENGWASAEHLESELTAEPLFESAALKALLQKPAQIALPFALGIAANRYYSGGQCINRAVELTLNYAQDAQISAMLRPETPMARRFRERLIGQIPARELVRYTGALEKLAMDDLYQEPALRSLAYLMPENKFFEVWASYLCSPDELLRQRAIGLLRTLQPKVVQLVLNCVDRSNDQIVASLLRNFREATSREKLNYDYLEDWMQRMDELACSACENVRSEANEWLRQRDEAVLQRSASMVHTQTNQASILIDGLQYDLIRVE